MILGLGWRVLRHRQDAEDVCQATFLLLARKAKTMTWHESIANWLYETAYRLCLKSRDAANRRQARQSRIKPQPAPDAMADITLRELETLLDEELTRLPKKLRAPLILCCLEGKARDEAARCLGVPLSTVISRLSEGRELLRRRLAGRGLVLSTALAGFTLLPGSVRAAVPAKLIDSTSQFAFQVLAGRSTTSVLSPKVAALIKGGVKAMFLANLKFATAVTAVVCLVAFGAAALGPWASAQSEDLATGTRAPALVNKEALERSRKQIQLAQAMDKVKETREPFKEARAAADAIDDMQWKAWMLQSIAEAQAKNGKRTEAARTFQDAIQAAKQIDPTSQALVTLGGIAAAQVRAGDPKSALKTAESIEDDEGRESALAEIVRAQARAGHVKDALKAAENISVQKKDYALEEVAAVMAQAGDIKEASRIVEAMGNDEDRVLPLAALAKAQVKAKDRKAAQKSFARALAIAEQMREGDGWCTRNHAFCHIAMAQAESGDLEGARKTIDTNTKKQVKDAALSFIATTQAATGNFKDAARTVEEIEHEYYKGEGLMGIVAAQIRGADLKSAQQTVASIKSVSWHIKALAEIAKAQAKAGDRDIAAKTLKEVLEKAGVEGGEIWDEEPGLGTPPSALSCKPRRKLGMRRKHSLGQRSSHQRYFARAPFLISRRESTFAS